MVTKTNTKIKTMIKTMIKKRLKVSCKKLCGLCYGAPRQKQYAVFHQST